MACVSCQENPCICAGGPELIVEPPDGSIEGGLGNLPCAICGVPMGDCCNLVDLKAEANGKSWIFSDGADIEIPDANPPESCGAQACCNELNPIIMGNYCPPVPLAPGTYRIDARFSVAPENPLQIIKPGTKVQILYFGDCSVILNPLVVDTYFKPCCCGVGGIADPIGEVVEASGWLMVKLENCQPLIRLQGVAGCPSDGANPERVFNLQFIMSPISSRELVECSGSALQSVFSDTAGCPPG